MKASVLFIIAAGLLLTAGLTSCNGDKTSTEDKIEETADKMIDNVAETQAVNVIKGDSQLPPAEGKMQVLDFNATWCGPCRQFAPNFDKVAEKYRSQATFYSIDVDENPSLAAQYEVESIPTIVYILPDGTVDRTVGYMDEAEFDNSVSAYLAK
ncbi:MAG: thioredoxin fold domain-containing protein [Muribaculaceae bacterium]|nr:thioredoxin fold domain-containing protein [Muribaculaceae bacterium]